MTLYKGLSAKKALFVNFLSALPCILGTLVVYGAKPNSTIQGCLLAFGGGNYMYLATVLAVGQFRVVTAKDMLSHFALFLFGAACIALVLLDHEHCTGGPVDPDDPHAGHNH